jgi:hypothetical protein
MKRRLPALPFLPLFTAWAALLSAALTWPGLARLGERVLGSPDADGLKHVWTLWWMRRAATQGEIPFHTDLVNFPAGMDLYPIEPLNGLLAAALAAAPLAAVTNLLALANLTAIGVCGALFGRALSGSAWGGFAAGTLLQGAAISLFTIHVGVGELQHLWWLPLGLTAWLKLRRGPGPLSALLLGLALAGAVLSCFYHGFYLAIAVSILSLLTLWAGPLSLAGAKATGRLLLAYAGAAGLSLLIALPVLGSFSSSYGNDDRPPITLEQYVLEDHGQPVTDPPEARLEPSQLFSSARERRATADRSTMAYGGGRYLGLAAGLLILGALALRPRQTLPLLAVAAVALVIALGSYQVEGGKEVLNEQGARIQLPFLFLNRALGYFAEPLNFPARALALVAVVAAGAAALVGGASVRGRSLGPVAAALALLNVADVQYNQLIPRPMPSFSVGRWPELAPLAAERGAMVDLTMAWNTDLETLMGSLTAQVAHGQKIQGVPIERIRYFAPEGQYFVQALPLVEDSRRAQRAPVDLDPSEYRRDLALLRDAGFDRIFVQGIGPYRDIPNPVRDSLKRLLGAPEIDSGQALVWRIPEVEATNTELDAWRAEHAERVTALKQRPFQHRGPGDI